MERECVEELSLLEARVGRRLPEDYRAFLLARGGLKEGRTTLRYWMRDGRSALVRVRRPYDLDPSRRPGWDLRGFHEIFIARASGEGLIPADAMVIASVDYSDVVMVLYVDGPRRGQVWLKDWRTLERTGVDKPDDDMVYIAPSFAALVDGLLCDE